MNSLKTMNPGMGALLNCWFPDNQAPNQTGPKFRPVFFLGKHFIKGQLHFAVAYGTSQTDELKVSKNGSDFIVTATSDRFVVLTKDTRIDFNNIKLVPATHEYFTRHKKDESVEMSQVNKCYYSIIGEAMRAARVPQKLSSMGVKL